MEIRRTIQTEEEISELDTNVIQIQDQNTKQDTGLVDSGAKNL